jgi:predicted ATPase/DNA-binding CsgD family transcriptional regulator
MRGEAAGNLPQELTSFVGRRTELADLRRLVAGSRLVTLVGTGGVGKTRLALRVAAGVHREFGAGVWLVELDQVQDDGLVAHAVARALGVRVPAGVPPATALTEFLTGRRLLLVLDNCEHLVCGVAKLVEALLRETGELGILATSRQALEVAGELTHRVAPLPVPDPWQAMELATLAGFEGLALFVERARAVVPGFELTEAHRAAVAEICARLGGLPLAIELAVARLRVLTPEQIRDRLSDQALLTAGRRTAPARQQTLRGCIEWSYDLCTRAERLLWARLSVFAGDFDVEAAEQVCADQRLGAGDVLELVASLLDKSILVRQEEIPGHEPPEVLGGRQRADQPDVVSVVRYRMLDSIRAYGREQLSQIGEETALRLRHLDWCRQLAAQFRANWIGPHQRDWLRRTDRTLPDIWAALEFGLTDPARTEAALATITDLKMYLIVSGLHNQHLHWLNRALAAGGEPSPARLEAHYDAASVAGAIGDAAGASRGIQQVRDIAEQLGDAHSRAVATNAEAVLAVSRGDLPAAVRHCTEGLDVFQAEGDPYWQTLSYNSLTLTKVLLDDMDGAAADHERTLAICQPLGECFFSGFSAMSLGIGLWKRGDLEAAGTQMRQSLKLLSQVGDTLATSWCLEVTAWIAAGEDKPRRAATLLGAAAGLAAPMGTRAAMWPVLLAYHDECEQQVRTRLGDEAFEVTYEHGRDLPLSDAIGYALGSRPDRPSSIGPAPSTVEPGDGLLSTLTRREREVAVHLAKGLSNKEIAAQLFVSVRTAEGHVESILKKLDCTSRAQAAALIVTASADVEPNRSDR